MDNVAKTVAAFFVLLFVLFLGWVIGQSGIENQCKNFGAFVVEKHKYACTPTETGEPRGT